MRAQELEPATTEPTLLASLGKYWIWKVPPQAYDKFAAIEKKTPQITNKEHIYWVAKKQVEVYDPQNNTVNMLPYTWDKLEPYQDYQYLLLMVQDNSLHLLSGSLMIPPQMLKKLADLTHAQNSPGLPARLVKNHVLYQGDVVPVRNMWPQYKKPSLDSGNTVFATPKPLLWTVGLESHTTPGLEPDWDTLWKISTKNNVVDLFVHGNHLVHMSYIVPMDRAEMNPLITQLVKREGWIQKVDLLPEKPAKKYKVLPGSLMHKMLQYVKENPGCNRHDWFVKYLGNSAQGLPGFLDVNAVDGRASRLGWLEDKSKSNQYSLHITAKGIMVLAALNAGKTVPYSI